MSRTREQIKAANARNYQRRKARGCYDRSKITLEQRDREAESKREQRRRKAEAEGRKRRFSMTRAELAERRQALREIAEEQRPTNNRAIFYQAASVKQITGIPKSEAGYDRVVDDLVWLREHGHVPYDWIVDETRAVDELETFGGIADALRATAGWYRRSLWTDLPVAVQIWVEKAALQAIISQMTHRYDVPLYVARGYSSLTFLHEAGERIASEGVPVYCYHFGDHDPSGVNAAEVTERKLREFAPNAEIHFKRVAVTMEQIRTWSLPTRPGKENDTRAAAWGDKPCVELDAIEPRRLRSLVERCILKHLPPGHIEAVRAQQEQERGRLEKLARRGR